MADVKDNRKVVYARLPPEDYMRLQQLVALETLNQGEKISLQQMISILINRAPLNTNGDSSLRKPSGRARAKAAGRRKSSSVKDKQLPDS